MVKTEIYGALSVHRSDRRRDELRKVEIHPGVNPYAEGSAEVRFGKTVVHVTASIEKGTPRWMEEGSGGWVTAEYGMLPRSTHTRNQREAAKGKQSGRTLEIQRLIGRSLRQAVDLKKLGAITIQIDCDVIVADGGTRTASITGGWVALAHAIVAAQAKELIPRDLQVMPIAAVSVGMVNGEPRLDLCYEEDSNAEFDFNLVYNQQLELVELQGTAERQALSRENLNSLLALGENGARQLLTIQTAAASQR